MKYRCQNCGKQYMCVYENNPPPVPFQKSTQHIASPDLRVSFKLQCRCGAHIGEVIHASPNPDQVGWWFLYPNLLAQGADKDWVALVKAASSSYLIRITNILTKLQKVEATALQINQILTQIKAKNNP